jgi:hypothetical protein
LLTHFETLLQNASKVVKNDITRIYPVRFIGEKPDPHFGYLSQKEWQDFVISAYCADLVSYPKVQDQVDFPRLQYLLSVFPQGFTVWQGERTNGEHYPLGYTGWYYTDEQTFSRVEQSEPITNRFFLPSSEPTPYLYLYNYSIHPELTATAFSRTLIQDYVSQIYRQDYAGLFCAAVSPDGIRVAERFGMKQTGTITPPEGRADKSAADTSADRLLLIRKRNHPCK